MFFSLASFVNGRSLRSRKQGMAAPHSLTPTVKAVTTGASATTLVATYRDHEVTTSGAGTAQTVTLPAAGEYVGQELYVKLKTRTHASDSLTFTLTNLVKEDNSTEPTAMTMAAANKFALFRWTGTKWHVIYKDTSTYT